MRAGKDTKASYSLRSLADDLWRFRVEIVGLLVACWGLVSLIALLRVTGGVLASAFADGLLWAFGAGAPAVSLAVVVVGAGLAAGWQPARAHPWRAVAGLALVWLALLLAADSFVPSRAGSPGYGGALGGLLGALLRALAGRPLQWVSASVIAFVGTHFALGLSLRRTAYAAYRLLLAGAASVWTFGRELVAELREALVTRPAPAPRQDSAPSVSAYEDSEAVAAPDDEPSLSVASAAAAPSQAQAAGDGNGMPPIEIFDPTIGEAGSDIDDRLKASIIEDALTSFGIPAKVTEVMHGPAVTRFGVEPGYFDQNTAGALVKRKVRVNKIKGLSDDLALALAAAPIRIEAPIPGRPLVGIEVPNSAVAAVGLRELLESPEYQGAKGALRIALGRDISGKPAVVPLERMPHLLIAGATGTGKSVCIGGMIASLLFSCAPADLRLLMIDPKRVELVRYKGVPHLLGKPEVEVEGAIAALKWACRQMDDRYKLFQKAGARDLAGYNRHPLDGEGPLPRMVIVIDELADLMLTSPDEVERSICRLAQMARATGIHLVVATQRPSVDVVTGLIKANFPSRISFAVSSQADSRVILDSPGAEALIGRGDMLYMASDSSKLVRLQGTYVTDEETRRLVSFWQGQVGEGQLLPVSPWSAILEEVEEDDMLAEAIAAAREAGTLSTSYLQRRLRVGYPRAARLLKEMEEAGIVTATKGGYRTVKSDGGSGDGDDDYPELAADVAGDEPE